jgi:predicted anti-sigma-YlaC factor YlaD
MMAKNECCELLTYLNDYVDGSLRGELCKVLEEHMSHCTNCEIVVNTLQKTVELYQQQDEHLQIPANTKRKLFLTLDLEDYLEK